MKRKPIIIPKQIVGAIVFVSMLVGIQAFVHYLTIHTTDTDGAGVDIDSLIAHNTQERNVRYDTVIIRMQPFDPNTADSITLMQLGLPRWQVRNIIKYRERKGHFAVKSDLKKIYGMSDSAYSELNPFILLPDSLPRKSKRQYTDSSFFASSDTLPKYNTHEKRDTIIELNTADTSSLQYIRGIGSYTARKIIAYRNRLGGYVAPEQLKEIDEIGFLVWDSVLPHLSANADSVRRLQVNFSSIEQMQRHPYISFTDAKAIYTLRRQKVRLHSIDDLQQLSFSRQWIERLKPYLDFSAERTAP